jgi:hypothetical protein
MLFDLATTHTTWSGCAWTLWFTSFSCGILASRPIDDDVIVQILYTKENDRDIFLFLSLASHREGKVVYGDGQHGLCSVPSVDAVFRV